MATPFLAEYTATFDADNKEAYADVVNQILMASRHNYDPKTGLFRHACDVSRQMGWADPETGQSQHCWGRALGWYMMAIVDALPFIPEGVEGRDSILVILQTIANGIDKYKDKKTGLWYQVMDEPNRKGNYLESSCSAMFIYSLLKAVRLGYLPKKYKALAQRSYKSFVKHFIYWSVEQTEDGSTANLANIGSCCAVAGLSKDRPGTFDYYINEKKQDNDPKVLGPFIRASLEMTY
jgi:unsaturated rhamnogalacturonyl hydrolase